MTNEIVAAFPLYLHDQESPTPAGIKVNFDDNVVILTFEHEDFVNNLKQIFEERSFMGLTLGWVKAERGGTDADDKN